MSRAFPHPKPTTITLQSSKLTIHLLRTESLSTTRPPLPAHTDRRIPRSITSLTSPPLSPPIDDRFTWSPIIPLPLPATRGAIAMGVRLTPDDQYPKYEARKIWMVPDASEMKKVEEEMREVVESETKGHEEWKGAEVTVVWSREERGVGERACVVVKGADGEDGDEEGKKYIWWETMICEIH